MKQTTIGGTDPLGPTGRGSPTRALAFFYVLLFGHVGIVLPFLAPWLEHRGFGALAIGVLLALPALAAALAPWCWGVWADRSGRRRGLFVVACLGAALSMAAMTAVRPAWIIGLLVAVYAVSRAPVLPYLEATTLEQSVRRRFAYGPIRLWGSVSFIVVSAGYGWLRGDLGADAGLLMAATMLGLAGVSAPALLPRPLGRARARADETPAAAGSPEGDRTGLVRFFAACALMQASHGAYYAFYSIHLQNLGYSGASIGALWSLGVVCEVLLFTRMDRIVDRFGTGGVMHASLFVAAVRWALIGSFQGVSALALAQTLHAVTYAAFHVAAIRVVHRRFGSEARAKGQTMYSGLTYGLGLFAGSLGAGWLTARAGIAPVFLLSSAVALSATLVLGRTARSAR